MIELIAVNYEGEQPTVSGRELHKALEVGTRYNDWFKRMCEYGFTENKDYILKNEYVSSDKRDRSYEQTDHNLTIPMAKEICMLQHNDKGKQFRHYFISVEEAWNSPEMVMKRALEFADKQVKALTLKIEQDKPKVLFANAVETAQTSMLIGDFAKLLKQNGLDIGQNRLFVRLRNEDYLIKSGERRNMPTQKAMKMGLFEIKERTVEKPNGSIMITRTPKITGKGQVYFINKFLGKSANDTLSYNENNAVPNRAKIQCQ
ncbi:MAG: phage antirepressor KilAC domain-containing protein [Lachnospiraceae bacterium]|nr:phage antirepressor KilAC domain-containing protein [Ruminococcus sp.]MCM1276145.1 phage antirepressor KilAC domain-containing protein [Lachnospiraceae bacterium]